MERYLYFRTKAADSADDATGASICLSANELTAMEPTGDSELALYFNGKAVIKLNLTTANTHLAAMRTIATAASSDQLPALVVVANDDITAGNEYLTYSGIASVGFITLY
jgi:hypothetical protein